MYPSSGSICYLAPPENREVMIVSKLKANILSALSIQRVSTSPPKSLNDMKMRSFKQALDQNSAQLCLDARLLLYAIWAAFSAPSRVCKIAILLRVVAHTFLFMALWRQGSIAPPNFTRST